MAVQEQQVELYMPPSAQVSATKQHAGEAEEKLTTSASRLVATEQRAREAEQQPTKELGAGPHAARDATSRELVTALFRRSNDDPPSCPKKAAALKRLCAAASGEHTSAEAGYARVVRVQVCMRHQQSPSCCR